MEASAKELDGRLVEVSFVGVADGERSDSSSSVLGRALWCEPMDQFLVQTLEGTCALVPEGCLQEASCAGQEASDWSRFDVFWPPSQADTKVFAAIVLEYLLRSGFCRVRMPSSDKNAREEVTSWARHSADFQRLQPERERAFLGDGVPGHDEIAWMTGKEAPHVLSINQRRLWGLHAVLLPLLGVLGFYPSSDCFRTFLRRRASGRSAVSPALRSDDVDAGVIESHIDFLRRRRICAVYALPGSRSRVKLTSNADSGAKPMSISIAEDELLLFRHDEMSYTYECGVNDFVLQTWFMEEPPIVRTDRYEGDQARINEMLGVVRGPREAYITSVACRFPMASCSPSELRGAFVAQTDGYVNIPYGRWDMDAYYSAELLPGKCVSRHAGLVSDELVTGFDCALFGMSSADALATPPSQRMVLEVGLEVAMRAGFTRKELVGAQFHCFIGDEGNEVETRPLPTGTRFSYALGLSGQCQTVKTACSSALVSVSLLHHALHARALEPQPGDQSMSRMGFAAGVGVLLSAQAFIGLSQALMLGAGGRSFTFDQSANGYNRGEGCGFVLLKVGDDKASVQPLEERLGGLNGSAVNQDGRSATLTAPNGPAQNKCIHSSLREAQVPGDSVTFTELHGTGTALGDPVEVGSVRGAFRGRALPMLLGAGKTNHGHLEAGAGTAGFIKAIATLLSGVAPSNCHLRHLNSNCEVPGFPAFFPTETVDIGSPSVLAGISAFGFGGTNSRADIFLTCHDSRRQGERREQKDRVAKGTDFVSVGCPKCSKPMCWLCGIAVPAALSEARHRCSALREESASYDHCSRCYTGQYLHGGTSDNK